MFNAPDSPRVSQNVGSLLDEKRNIFKIYKQVRYSAQEKGATPSAAWIGLIQQVEGPLLAGRGQRVALTGTSLSLIENKTQLETKWGNN